MPCLRITRLGAPPELAGVRARQRVLVTGAAGPGGPAGFGDGPPPAPYDVLIDTVGGAALPGRLDAVAPGGVAVIVLEVSS